MTKQINPINNTNGKSPGKNIINRISNSQYIKSILSYKCNNPLTSCNASDVLSTARI